jgi:squalene-associated FAD-dependent desaturase
MSERIAIIGGGWSGLAAAVTLANAGVACTVFEASRQLGGRARRIQIDGETLDNGQHILLGAYARTLQLLRLVHPTTPESDLLVRVPLTVARPGGLQLRACRLPAPLNLLAALATARGITVGERLAVAAFLTGLKRRRFHADAALSVARLIRNQPAVLIEQLWNPLCLAALNTPPRVASAQIFLNTLCAALNGSRAASDLLLPRVDLGALFPEPAAAFALARGSELRLGEPVLSLRTLPDRRFEIELRGGSETYAQIICAVAPQQLSRLLTSVAQLSSLRARVDDLAYHSIATVYARYDQPPQLPMAMLQLDANPGQWLFDRGQIGGPRGLFAVVISAADDATGLDRDALLGAVRQQLRRIWPDWPEPRWMKAIVEKRATFACTTGLARPSAGPLLPGLHLAGDYTDAEYPATIEAAVRTGMAAARSAMTEANHA